MYQVTIDHVCGFILKTAQFYLNPSKHEFLTEEEEKDFLKAYIDKRRELSGKSGETPSEAVEKLNGICKLFKPVNN